MTKLDESGLMLGMGARTGIVVGKMEEVWSWEKDGEGKGVEGGAVGDPGSR